MHFIIALVGLTCVFVPTRAQTTQTPNEIFRIALAATNEGDYNLALTSFNRAISIDPNRNYFYYNRGMLYKTMGKPDMALPDFQKSSELKPTAEAHYQMGLIKYQRDDFAGAKNEFEQAKLIREDLDNLNFYLGMIYFKDKNYEDALRCFQLFTARVVNNPDAFYFRGFCEAKAGKYEEALLSLKAALIYKDRDWKFYFKMYEVYLALGDKQDALNNITMIIEMGNGKPEFYEYRAKLYQEMGMDFKADEDLQSAKQARENPPVATAK